MSAAMTTPRLPNFVVIGAPKSGTTSLFYYLRQHPDVYLPVRKELHYFSHDLIAANAQGPGDALTVSALCKGLDEYRAHYRDAAGQAAVGEVSPSYLYYAEVAEAIERTLVPGPVRIVAVLRNPIEKAYSQYMHLVRDGWEELSFCDALQAEPERRERRWGDFWRYAESSLYSARLRTYVERFGRENVHVLLFDDLAADPGGAMRDLFAFLGVDPSFPCDTSKVLNRSGRSRSRFVRDFFANPNALKALVKRLVPERVRVPLRLAILGWNTGGKGTIEPRAADHLRERFAADVTELAGLLGRELPWPQWRGRP